MTIDEIRQQYPQYADMTDGDLTRALHRKFYADMPYKDFAKTIGAQDQRMDNGGASGKSASAPALPVGQSVPLAAEPSGPGAPPSGMELGVRGALQALGLPALEGDLHPDLGRQLGLTARAGAEGLAAIPASIGDAVGLHSTEVLGRVLDTLGLPNPQSVTERFANRVAGGMANVGGTSAALGRALPALTKNIGTQIAAGGGAAGGSDLAQELGMGPMGQAVAGLATGVALPVAGAFAGTGARAAGRFATNVVRPFTAAGRQDLAAKVFQGAASDPQDAIAAINSAPQYVPGVKPTTAEVANDTGLSGLSKAVKTQNPAPFADQAAANDAARQAALKNSFGSPSDLIVAQNERDAATAPMRQGVFADAKNVNTKPVVQLGNALLNAGAKYRGPVGPMLQRFVNDISEIKDPEVLYNGPRKAINDVLSGQASRDTPVAQFTKSELISLRNQIDAQIEKAAPGFKNYLDTYSGMSREIDKARLGQDITQSSMNASTDTLSPAKFANNFQKSGEDIAAAGPVASDNLYRVNEDLKRSIAPNAAMRAPGSDTAQNTVASNMLNVANNLPGGPATRTITRFVSSIYSPQEEKVRQLVLQGALDPATAKLLLSRQLKNQPHLIPQLLARLLPISYGGVGGAIGSQQPFYQ